MRLLPVFRIDDDSIVWEVEKHVEYVRFTIDVKILAEKIIIIIARMGKEEKNLNFFYKAVAQLLHKSQVMMLIIMHC